LTPYQEKEVLLEFSVSYSYPEYFYTAAEAMAKHIPEARIFLAVRNPIDRAFSDYMRSLRHMEINASWSFERAIKKWPVLLERGLYSKVLRRYLEFYPKDRIFVLFFDDLMKDPARYFGSLLEFIGVSADQNIQCLQKNRISRRPVPIRGHEKMIYKTSHLVIVVLEKAGFEKVWKRVWSRFQKPFYRLVFSEQVDREIAAGPRKRLREYFENDIRDLEKMTGKDLSSWV
jgi:hypothetical protein